MNEIENETDENYNMRKYAQSVATEMKAIKLVMKEQLYLLKTSNSEINSNTDIDGSTITESTKFRLRIKIT